MWNPDPKWPRHIIMLAEVIVEGDDVREPLHDALLEEGLPLTAIEILHTVLGKCWVKPEWAASFIIGIILNDTYRCGWQGVPYLKEIEAHLKR